MVDKTDFCHYNSTMELVDVLIELYAKLLSLYNKRTKNMVETSSNELSYSHINYLEIIASKDRIKPSELARLMDVSKPAVTSIIDVLIRKGYVEKDQCQKDKRVFYISITDKYRQYRYPGVKLTEDFLTKLYIAFADEDIDYIKHMLEKIVKII